MYISIYTIVKFTFQIDNISLLPHVEKIAEYVPFCVQIRCGLLIGSEAHDNFVQLQ